MGSCISKCRPKKKLKQDCSHVHDKLVISQDPISSPHPLDESTMPLEKPLSPAPSLSSTASLSSFSCSNNTKCTMASSSSSSSSCSSSALSAKDRYFTNEFLWSCVKENPHIVGLNPMVNQKHSLGKPFESANTVHQQNPDPSSLVASPVVSKPKQSLQERSLINASSTPKKRARASSPTLVRQKSHRKEQNSVCSMPNTGLRSPSPSRRFNGDNNRVFPTYGTNEYSGRRQAVSKGNAVSSAACGVKRESFRAPTASPNSDNLMISRNFPVRKKEVFSQQVSTNTGDGVAVGDIKCSQGMDTVMEDIDNPHIALDCFIFL